MNKKMFEVSFNIWQSEFGGYEGVIYVDEYRVGSVNGPTPEGVWDVLHECLYGDPLNGDEGELSRMFASLKD